jgi:DNA replication licensing factor MCM7
MGLSQHVPNALRRRFRVNFQPDIKCEKRSIRSIRAADIGHLVTFMVCLILELYPEDCILLADTQGICTRVGDVKPLVEVACLTCECCAMESTDHLVKISVHVIISGCHNFLFRSAVSGDESIKIY